MKTKQFTRGVSTLAIMALAVLSLLSARATELAVNGGFESGTTGWTFSGTPYPAEVTSQGGFARSGSYYLWLGGAFNVSDSAYQTITIPANATAATLSFYYNINSLEGNSVANDTFSATIRNSSGTVLATVGNWSNKNQTSPGSCCYSLASFNLLPYAGQTIRVYFTSVNNSTLVTNFRVDDVSVSVTGPSTTVPTVQTVAATAITPTSARINGTIPSDGGSAIVERRFDWGTSFGNLNQWTANVTVSGNNFSYNLAGLNPDTLYYFRAWAKNGSSANVGYGVGWNIGTVLSFRTSTGQTAPSITTQPANQSKNTGQSATFTTAASGNPAPSFQWQRSTDGGASWNNLSNDGTHSGVTTATLTVNDTTTAMSGYRFRAIASNGVSPNATSSAATLTVNPAQTAPSITTQPANRSVTAGQNASFTIAAGGNPMPSFQWQRSTDSGATWYNLSNDGTHSGVTTATLTINNTTTAMGGYRFRAIASNGVTPNATSNAATLTVNSGQQGEPASLGVGWNPSPHFDNRNQSIDTIVIHTTEGSTAQGAIDWMLQVGTSAHYVISPSGDITQLVELDKRAWHATYYNHRSIGIEMVGFANQQATWNAQNLAALENLVAYLVQKYNISIIHPTGDACSYAGTWFTPSGLVGHGQIQPSPCYPKTVGSISYAVKSDPGAYFPWSSFVQNVQQKTGTTPNYTITASAGAGGTISPSGNIDKNAGESQTFTASPNAGYTVNQWLVNSSVVQTGGDSYTLSDIQADRSVQVTFTTIGDLPPTMTLNSPNAGATWQVGTSQTVNWSVSGNTSQINYFVVRLSINDGSSYTDISPQLNASARSFNYTPTSGQASSSAVIWVRAFDSTDTVLAAAISSDAFTITPDIAPPALTISSPANGATVTSSSVTVSGTATDSGRGNSGITSVTVNGVRASNDTAAGSGTATWSRSVSLSLGPNPITVIATDGAGNQTTSSRSVTRSDMLQTITFNQPPNKTYGDAPFPLMASASSGLPVSFQVVSGPATIASLNTLTITGAGSVTVRASQPGNAGWLPAADVPRTFTVAKAPLTARADNKTKVQGAANPPLTITYTGFVDGNGSGMIDVPPTATTTATASSPVGVYPITLSGGTDNNYALTLQNGTLTVTHSPAISLSGDLVFGNVTVGSSAQRILTIANTGNSTLTVGGINYPSGFSGNWSGTIPEGGSQPVSVTFSPTDTITYSGNLTVNSDKTSGTNTRSVSGNGTVTPPRFTGLGGGRLQPPSNGQFQIEVHASQPQVTIQASDDLKNWTDVGTVNTGNGPAVFTDPNAGSHPKRFYRPKP